jgi:hypothetical protein
MFDGELISLNDDQFAFLMLDLSELAATDPVVSVPSIEWAPAGFGSESELFVLANNPDEPATLQLASAPPGELHWVA